MTAKWLIAVSYADGTGETTGRWLDWTEAIGALGELDPTRGLISVAVLNEHAVDAMSRVGLGVVDELRRAVLATGQRGGLRLVLDEPAQCQGVGQVVEKRFGRPSPAESVIPVSCPVCGRVVDGDPHTDGGFRVLDHRPWPDP